MNNAIPIEIDRISKRFGDFLALDDVSLSVEPGEFIALLGPSGCGKTTLLRVLAGLEEPDAGTIRIGGVDAGKWCVAARQVGFVFQHYALFRHMSVFENIAFGLRVRRENRPPRAEIRRRVEALLSLVKLDGFGDRLPGQLSGGQRQRVALARALAVEPRFLLLDEPFAALDANVRKELRRWLRRLHDEIHITSLFVTHDVEEALEMADRIVVMDHGKIVQTGTPEEVYENPASPFVLHFLGDANRFHARMEHGRVEVSSASPSGLAAYARPHDVQLSREPSGDESFEAVVLRAQGIGPIVRVELRRHDEDGVIEAEISRDRQRVLALRPGDRVHVRFGHVSVFPPGRQQADPPPPPE
ncbi:MAG: sulfate/molybdate ABC transporter ATP-binding protein [Kiritimatiellia bacterium]|jgi:sulfate transport system ATP-binding protein